MKAIHILKIISRFHETGESNMAQIKFIQNKIQWIYSFRKYILNSILQIINLLILLENINSLFMKENDLKEVYCWENLN